MFDLPASVASSLCSLITTERAPAYLIVDGSLTLRGAGGSLQNYGLEALALGCPATEQAVFLEGLLPFGETPLVMKAVEMPSGRAADLHFHPAQEGGWILLLDCTAERAETQRLQQWAYDMTLLRQREARLKEELAVAFAALERSNEELKRLSVKLEEENLRLSAELEVARRLQEMLLPTPEELRNAQHVDVACFMQPAAEVGGDYYDVLQYGGHTFIAIGDVTGHGLHSGVVMLMAQVGVRALIASKDSDPVRFFQVLNRTLHDNIARMRGDRSLSLAVLDFKDGEVRVSGQHEQIIVVRRGGQVELVDTLDLGFPIGLYDDIASFVHEKKVRLGAGDGVVLYTDGFTEAENPAGEQYGLERLCEAVRLNWAKPVEAIKDAIVADVREFIDVQTVYDDLTLVVAKQKR